MGSETFWLLNRAVQCDGSGKLVRTGYSAAGFDLRRSRHGLGPGSDGRVRTIPDPRSAAGRRYPLPALLNLLAVATLAGMRSLEGIAQFAREHGVALTHALGFRSGRTPCKATLPNLLRRLDIRAYEGALARWVRARCPDVGDHLCLDGKTARGSETKDLPGSTGCRPTPRTWPG